MTWEPFQEPNGPQGPFTEYGAYRPPTTMPPPPYGPQTAWGAPGPGVNAPPRSLWEAIKQLPKQYWRVITRPGAATFAAEMGQARWDIIWAQILGYALIGAIFASLAWLILAALLSAWLSAIPTASGQSNPGAAVGAVFFLPVPIYGVIAFASGVGGFFLGQGITYGLARAFGGQGSFMVHVYTSLLYQVPIGLVALVLSLIPVAGSIGGLASIYGYFLEYFQLQVVHRLSTGKAIAVILIPIGAGVLLVFILVLIYFVFIFSILGALHPAQ